MTSQSPRIYLYKITFEEVPYYYYGVHKETKYNDYYMGSPITHKWMWNFYTPKKQILQFFDFTDAGWLEAQEVEKRLIKPFYNTDKWCLNERCGYTFSLETSRKNGVKHKENCTGFFSRTPEEWSAHNRKNGLKSYENGTGVFSRTLEEMKEDGRRAGLKCKKNRTGFFAQTPEQWSETGRKSASQRWECIETGYVSNAPGLSTYQRNRGIDTSKRKRIS